jgi:hypothetical protein
VTRLRVALASIAAIAALPAAAADWRVTPSMTSGVDYIDNPRLIPGVDDGYAAARADATIGLSMSTEVASVDLVPRFIYAEYPDDPLLNRRDAYVTLSVRRLFETVSWLGSFDYTRDTTITSEFGLTGLQNVNRDHEALSLSLGPTWTVSERLQVGAQAYGLDTKYIDAERTGLTDYTYALVSASATYVLTENATGGLQASVGELRVPLVSRRDRDIDTSLSVDWRMSEQWRLRLAYGPTRVESDQGDTQGYIYSGSVTKEYLRSTLRLAVERDVTPTGRGVLVTRDQVSFGVTYALSPRTSLSVSTRAVRTIDAVRVAGASGQTNEFASLESSIRWYLAERWSVVFAAGGRYLGYQERDHEASGFNASLGVAWNGQSRAMSR